jgi:hypothetical protein
MPSSVSSFFAAAGGDNASFRPDNTAGLLPTRSDIDGHLTVDGGAVRPFVGSCESVSRNSTCSCCCNGDQPSPHHPDGGGGMANTSFSSQSSSCSRRSLARQGGGSTSSVAFGVNSSCHRPSSRSSCSSGLSGSSSSGGGRGRDVSGLDYAEMIREGTVNFSIRWCTYGTIPFLPFLLPCVIFRHNIIRYF